jgi:hypothetical protein
MPAAMVNDLYAVCIAMEANAYALLSRNPASNKAGIGGRQGNY